ncbi:hypothetical protein HZ989_07360 [Brevundimonas sp. AJA228-03]|uniref:DUF7380 domain-containing protein n=1 Tax=Brevundimonas sp. AJA228-03 TaxID=2752515 RepID=UPI001AE019B2|nr:hypothetical protein [Brevundimonas sp. AJA228-03]QTN20853.1 hypothetical protein HZ989_07360 [Brevundimonas sp. AJA228-03]
MSPHEPGSQLTWPPPPVPATEFDVAEIEALSVGIPHDEPGALEARFLERFRNTSGTGGAPWFWLAGAVGLVLRPSDQGAPWGPRAIGVGWRAPAVEDFAPQIEAFIEVARQVSHIGLRARLADIAWTNHRARGDAARMAVDAYCGWVDRLLAGVVTPRYGVAGPVAFETLDAAHRALQLARRITKRGQRDAVSGDALCRLYERGKTSRVVTVFGATADLALYYDLIPAKAVAADLETVGDDAPERYDPLAVSRLFDRAAQIHLQAGNEDAQRRCQLSAVRQILRMRGQVSGAGAEAHWVQTALLALRGVQGQDNWRRELRRELRDLQEDSLSEFVMTRIPLDLGDERDEAFRTFEALSLGAGMKELAVIGRSQPVEDLQAEALRSLDRFPLGAMMSKRHSDEDGRTAANTPTGDREDPDDDWMKERINESEGFRRRIIIEGRFDPARLTLATRHNLEERHLLPIVGQSPFVRREQVGLMSLGFLRLLQGDDRSAVHLLIPQLEPCLRHVLRVAGHDPTVEFEDMTEENVSLNALLGRLRPQLEAILPPAVVLELELLFDFRAGSALRHSVAHGRIGAGGCFHHDAVYACWLMYQLTCWPLLRNWSSQVAPHIDAQL